MSTGPTTLLGKHALHNGLLRGRLWQRTTMTRICADRGGLTAVVILLFYHFPKDGLIQV